MCHEVSLGHELLCANGIYELHRKSGGLTAASWLGLLGQPGEEKIQHVYYYDCRINQERLNVSAVPLVPSVSSQPLSSRLAYPGFREQCHQQDNSHCKQDEQRNNWHSRQDTQDPAGREPQWLNDSSLFPDLAMICDYIPLHHHDCSLCF